LSDVDDDGLGLELLDVGGVVSLAEPVGDGDPVGDAELPVALPIDPGVVEEPLFVAVSGVVGDDDEGEGEGEGADGVAGILGLED
jgi:hypothetical protein